MKGFSLFFAPRFVVIKNLRASFFALPRSFVRWLRGVRINLRLFVLLSFYIVIIFFEHSIYLPHQCLSRASPLSPRRDEDMSVVFRDQWNGEGKCESTGDRERKKRGGEKTEEDIARSTWEKSFTKVQQWKCKHIYIYVYIDVYMYVHYFYIYVVEPPSTSVSVPSHASLDFLEFFSFFYLVQS